MAKKAFVSAALLLSSCALAWGQTGNYGTGSNTVNITATDENHLTITVNGDATTITDISKNIETAILAGNYSTITVAGGQINSEIVHSILYQCIYNEHYSFYKKNESLTTIDLGTTTVTDFTTNTFKYDNVWQGNCNLETITLPLATRDADGKMTVPSTVLSFTTYNAQSKVKTVIVPEGYTNIGEKAFFGFNNGINFDFTISLPNSLRKIGTSAFEELKMTDIILPEGLETIGKRAFFSCKNLTDPKFPSTLKEILSEAYSKAESIKNIVFNDNIRFIGNSAFYLAGTTAGCQNTIIFPEFLEYIGPGAFTCRRFTDIYFNSERAPLCPIGKIFSNESGLIESAFEDCVHMGNTGFKPSNKTDKEGDICDDINSGYANRENYKNNGVYLAMLHFPENITSEKAETYTDITREYKTQFNSDGTFNVAASFKVGDEQKKLNYNNVLNGEENIIEVNPGYIDTYRGDQYIWPSRSQWMRSFVCNSLGYKWDGVTEYRPTLTDNQIALMIKDGLIIENAGTITESNKDEYADELSMTAYMGTRQFVFANGDHEASNEYKVKDIQGGYWWTLCVPFNMTKKQIDDVFGPGTHVCRFSEVYRDDDSNEKKITLKFQHDVYAHKTLKEKGIYAKFDKTADPCNDNDTVIYAHESYMIHPTKTNDDVVFVVKNYEPITGSPLPTIVKANDNTEYRFIGNYTAEMSGDETVQRIRTVTIPKYSYIYAKKKNEDISMYKFWFYNGGSLKWSSNKCVVQATAKDGGAKDYENFFGTINQAKQFSVFGSDDIDDKPTEIEHVEIIAGEQPQNGIKYDLYGRRVSDNYKGIYIMNGKKYINR